MRQSNSLFLIDFWIHCSLLFSQVASVLQAEEHDTALSCKFMEEAVILSYILIRIQTQFLKGEPCLCWSFVPVILS